LGEREEGEFILADKGKRLYFARGCPSRRAGGAIQLLARRRAFIV